MSRVLVIPVLTLSLILLVALFSGCGEESITVNNSTPTFSDVSPTPRPNLVSSDTSPASGWVYFEGMGTSGGPVEAISLDGKDWVSTNTNESGFYTLNLKTDQSYRVTAKYNGRQHTIWPVKGGIGRDDFINLTLRPTSAIAGGSGSSLVPGFFIEAIPQDGGVPANIFTDQNGSYALEVEPGTTYCLRGLIYDEWGDGFGAYFTYRNWSEMRNVSVGPDETSLIDYQVSWHHPPKSFFMNFSAPGLEVFKPSGPVPASGHVYLDSQPVAYATVVAVSSVGGKNYSTQTNNFGAYTLELTPRSLYTITAKQGGLQHSIKPAFVWENSANEYYAFLNSYQFDINLTTTHGSTIKGVWRGEPEQNWTDMLIEARPRTGSAPIYAAPDADGSFSIPVEPQVYYDLSLISRITGEQNPHIRFLYHTGLDRTSYLLNPNETVLVDYDNYQYI